MFLDPRYFLIVGPALLFAMWASFRVKSAYAKYSQVGNYAGLTGAQAAAAMLEQQGLRVVASAEESRQTKGAVSIACAQGFLSDHYDPRERVLRLSPGVYGNTSLAAIGIACHEAGHALQHAQNYSPLEFRTALVPTASLGSWAAFPLIFIGFLLHFPPLILIGILGFTLVLFFQLVTLPVEFNASSRAKAALSQMRMVQTQGEAQAVAAVLDAAALTYVAAAVSSVATLLYYLTILTGGSRD
ncbi:MAG TPA: zinc metallopeptidase [Candidatus Sumerlaeota bacterium]|nr:zinc metallopeptidase [Candidatus Sumerlaeota bacterium]HPS02023.1 zinc metallopeptidase [Candidatus Sumerlaeota bacterium]